MDEFKKIFNDKVKFSYIISFSLAAIFAILLLVKHDIGNFFKLGRAMQDARTNLNVLADSVEYKDYVRKFDLQFVEPRSADWLMEVLTGLSDKEDITVGLVKPLEIRTVPGYKIIRVSANGSASYDNLLRLLKELESYKKYIYVEDLSINAAGPEAGSMYTAPGGRINEPLPQAGAKIAKFTLTVASLNSEI